MTRIAMDRRILAIVIVSIVAMMQSHAQIGLTRISAHAGAIRTLFPDYSHFSSHQYAFYPEVQLGGELFTAFVGWEVYWGFWDDGLNEPLSVADMVTYSNSAHIVGLRVSLLPFKVAPGWPLPVGVFAGLARHFVATTYVGGFGLDGGRGFDHKQNTTTAEVGILADIHIAGGWSVKGEARQFIPLGNDEVDTHQRGRRAYTVGITFTFL